MEAEYISILLLFKFSQQAVPSLKFTVEFHNSMTDRPLNQVTTISFHIPSNLLFSNHPIIRCCRL